MTITLTLLEQSKPDQKQKIADKLNELIYGKHTHMRFFHWIGSRLVCGTCANVDCHNKVVIFLALFCDFYSSSCDSYTSFGGDGGLSFFIPETLVKKLENTIDNINSISDINITLN